MNRTVVILAAIVTFGLAIANLILAQNLILPLSVMKLHSDPRSPARRRGVGGRQEHDSTVVRPARAGTMRTVTP